MAGQVRFGKQAKPCHATRARKLMPHGLCHRLEREFFDETVEKAPERPHIRKSVGIAPVSINDPLHSGHRHACELPHSGQNFAFPGIDFPQLMQNFVSPAGAPP